MPDDEKADVVLISVSSRVPEFWTDQPNVWFVTFEVVIAPQKSSDEAQYQLLVAKLGKQVVMQVADILTNPPAAKKYATLKQRLLEVYEESENRRVQKLVGDMQLGDQKPSQLFRQMQTLAGDRIAAPTLLVMWQNHLPAAVRAILAATAIKDPEQLAAVADKIQENSNPGVVAEVASSSAGTLADTIAQLSLEVAELRRSRSYERNVQQASGRPQSRARSTSRKRSKPRQEGLCFYHDRFGTRARKCRSPCTWSDDNKGNH